MHKTNSMAIRFGYSQLIDNRNPLIGFCLTQRLLSIIVEHSDTRRAIYQYQCPIPTRSAIR